MARQKPIPRSQRLKVNRGEQVSRSSPNAKDTVKNISVGIMDMDSAIMYYFNEVIQPSVSENKEIVKVPCLYASPERWVSIQKQGFLRDKKRQTIVPLIVFKRTGIEKNENIPVDKLDANNPNHFYTFEQKYSQQQRYDRFSVQQGLFHNKELYNVVIPDYVTLSYEFTIWTSYIEQMNKIVEKINYSDGAYWGEPGKMRFRTTIESFSDATEIDTERLIKTTFSVQMYGYIIPESFNKYVTTKKYLTPKQIILKDDVDVQLASLIKPEAGVQSITVTQANKVSSAKTTLTNALTLTGGTGVAMTGVTNFTGETAALGTISIGQDVGTTSNVVFNDVSASSAIHVGDTSFTISQRADGTAQVDKDWHVLGDIVAENYIVSSSVMYMTQSFASGDNIFGDTLTDNQRFTGSMDVTGSIYINGVEVSTGGGDFSDGSANTISGSSSSTGSFGYVESHGDLLINQYIRHKGDLNTKINMTDDRIQLEPGNLAFIGAHKKSSAPHQVTINNGGNNIDFVVKDNSNNRIFQTDASTSAVEFPLTNAKISGSSTSTGSFGALEVAGKVQGDITFGDTLTMEGHLYIPDSIVHASDTNTKIRFPEVDTIAFNTSGNERLRIDANGHITASGEMIIGSNEKLYLNKSEDTYIQSMAGDIARVVAGGSQMLILDYDTGNRAVFGNGTKVYIGSNNNALPEKEVEVAGDILATGDISANGNIIAQNYIVSSSITHMTQSFSSGSTIFGDTLTDSHIFTGSMDVSGSLTLNGSAVGTSVSTFDEYIRKTFVKKSNSITSTTASFTAVTASAPSGLTATSENDFKFFINGQYMEHDALTIEQSGSIFLLQVDTSSIGYTLESDDEIIAQGKFNS